MDQLSHVEGPSYEDYIAHSIDASVSDTEYWTEYLKDVEPCLLPASAPDGYTERGNFQHIDIKLDKATSLHSFCETHGITVPILIQSAWSIILHLFAQTSSMTFGYLVSGRHLPVNGVKDIVGAIITPLICAITLDTSTTLKYILDLIQKNYHQSHPHQSGCLSAMEKLDLNPPSQKLFNTLVNHRKASSPPPDESSSNMPFDVVASQDRIEVCESLHVIQHRAASRRR